MSNVIFEPLKLSLGPQTADVVILASHPNAARFAYSWPDTGLGAESGQIRRWVVVILPDEGHTSILLETGRTEWAHLGLLPIRIQPGTEADFERVGLEDLAEALGQWMDAHHVRGIGDD